MTGDANDAVIALLAASVAFNLLLTLRLVRIVGRSEALKLPFALPAGQALPAFSGRTLIDGRRVRAQYLDGQAAVLLFFAPECKDCQARVAELTTMYPAMRRAGVGLWVVASISKRRMRTFLAGTPLLDHVLIVPERVLRALNPRGSAPFYVFVDHECKVVASDFIGDADWLSFCAQMGEVAATATETPAAAPVAPA